MIKACIFDLGGTIVDRYSLTTLMSLGKAFSNKHINVPSSLLREHMRSNKIDHIHKIFEVNHIQNLWHNRHLDNIDDKVKQDIFNDFSKIQEVETYENMEIIPQTKKCIQYLSDNNIYRAATSGLDRYQVNRIRLLLEKNSIYLNNYVSSTCIDKPDTDKPGPKPYMIYENMKRLDIADPKKIIKVSDTVDGIKEGLNANCITVGVYRWSNHMNIDSREEMLKIDNVIMSGPGYNYSDNYYQLVKKMLYSKRKLEDSGAHYVIQTLEDLPNIIEHINKMKSPNPYNLYF